MSDPLTEAREALVMRVQLGLDHLAHDHPGVPGSDTCRRCDADRALDALAAQLAEAKDALEVMQDGWAKYEDAKVRLGEAAAQLADRDEENTRLREAQAWYRSHVTEDGIYDEATWGDPFHISPQLRAALAAKDGLLSDVRAGERAWQERAYLAERECERLRKALSDLLDWVPHTEAVLAATHPQHREAVAKARAALAREEQNDG